MSARHAPLAQTIASVSGFCSLDGAIPRASEGAEFMVSSIRRTLKVELDVTEITEQASETDTGRSLAAYTMEQLNHFSHLV
jgi:hypothetical protein